MIRFKLLFWCLVGVAQTVTAQNDLLKNFQSPPAAAKPRVWWHWMNGNITKEGIQKDLDWMQRIGIGGFQNFDANLFTPVVVPQKLVFMTPAWKDAFKFTATVADQKGLEMAIAGSPGWSVTGGPWVTPADAMKKYVWTETLVKGGQTLSLKLTEPSNVVGKYQNVAIAEGGFSGSFIGEKPHYYEDGLVIAYKLPRPEISLHDLRPVVTSSGGNFSLHQLTDGDLNARFELPPMNVGEDMWIQYSFAEPQTFKAFSVAGASESLLAEFNGGPENRKLKVSDDGLNFREIARVSGSTVPYNTVSFPPATARYWRLCVETLAPTPNLFLAMAGINAGEPKPEGIRIGEWVLHATERIDQVEDKAGFSPWKESTTYFQPAGLDAISSAQVLNLTAQLTPDGTLNWDAPPGDWSIIRLGYSLTGRQNHPASPEATGLEVDKLNPDAVRRYINTYLDMYQDATGGLMGARGLQYMVLDSYEAGHMNWTQKFPEEFKQRRGYELWPWTPVLTGRIVNTAEDSEKFLWDFRKTIGELIAVNHYDVIGEALNQRRMKRYTESHEGGRIYLADGMDVKRNAEIPMSAMWTPGSLAGTTEEEVRSEADIRESASVANIYGKPIVAAESMTSVGRLFQEHPERLKRTADLELASGLNRYVIHTSVHQPLDDKKPGFSLGPFGQYFTRQETWAEQAKYWVDYLSRSCYLLQQGLNVADVLYYYGENTNITWICREKLPVIPAGVEFDFVNSSALLSAIKAKDGKLIAQSGNAYHVLMLDESATLMTLPVLKKIKELAESGIKIIGDKPRRSPSLADDDAAFQQLAQSVWSRPNVGPQVQWLIEPDVSVGGTEQRILFRHRRTEEADIYWLNNRSAETTSAKISFRIQGKIPELWHPQTGTTHPVSYTISAGRTEVYLDFSPWDAYFIIFKDQAKTNMATVPARTEEKVISLSGPWPVSFGDHRVVWPALMSWPESSDAAIKYFSGTATYQTTFSVHPWRKGTQFMLDLGEVKNIAEIIVNGQHLGGVWKTPFRLNITGALKKGVNALEIRVTNTWVNRLIGDAQPETKNKTTFTTMPFYQANSPLVPAGLLGPVNVIRVDKRKK